MPWNLDLLCDVFVCASDAAAAAAAADADAEPMLLLLTTLGDR